LMILFPFMSDSTESGILLSPRHTVPKLTPDVHTIKEMFKFGFDRNNIGPFVRAS